MKNVYVLRNKAISAYLDPFVDERTKDQVGKSLARFCILEKEQAKKSHYDECELYVLGTYDDETGVITIAPEKEFVLAFDQFFVEK